MQMWGWYSWEWDFLLDCYFCMLFGLGYVLCICIMCVYIIYMYIFIHIYIYVKYATMCLIDRYDIFNGSFNGTLAMRICPSKPFMSQALSLPDHNISRCQVSSQPDISSIMKVYDQGLIGWFP